MSNPDASNSSNSRDVLSSLPSTRPQRRSPKRDGAKQAKPRGKAASAGAAGKAGAGNVRAGTAAASGARGGGAAKPRSQGAPRRQNAHAGKTVAAQGYHPVSDTTPVEPPTGTELLASAVHAAGEVAQLGLTLGERLLRSAASRLPKP